MKTPIVVDSVTTQTNAIVPPEIPPTLSELMLMTTSALQVGTWRFLQLTP